MVAQISQKHCCWFDDPDEVNWFAHSILAELFWGARERVDVVLEYFEKPWKYDELHGVWALYGHPTIDEGEDWERFIDEAERLDLL